MGHQPIHRVAQSYLGPLWIAMDRRGSAGGQLRMLRRLYLPADAPESARRAILAVAKEAARLRHDHVLGVLEVLEQDGLIAVAYEHLEAEPLRSLQSWANLRCLSFPVGVSLRIIIDLLRGVEATHKAFAGSASPALFGGLSPDSVLVSRDGATRLSDPLISGCASLLQAIGFSTAKLAYAAPEQIHAVAPLGPQCDVFSCGAMLWELLATRRLLAGSRPAIERKLLEHDLPSLRAHVGEATVSPALASLVEEALAADPQRRPPGAQQLAARLAACGHDVATLGEVAHFVGKLSGQRFDRRTAAVRSKTLSQLDAPLEWPIEVATKPRGTRRGARGGGPPVSQVATPRRADLVATPASPPAAPFAPAPPPSPAMPLAPSAAPPALPLAPGSPPSPRLSHPFEAGSQAAGPPAMPPSPARPPARTVAAATPLAAETATQARPDPPFSAPDLPFRAAPVAVAALARAAPDGAAVAPPARHDRTITGLGASTHREMGSVRPPLAHPPASPPGSSPWASPGPAGTAPAAPQPSGKQNTPRWRGSLREAARTRWARACSRVAATSNRQRTWLAAAAGLLLVCVAAAAAGWLPQGSPSAAADSAPRQAAAGTVPERLEALRAPGAKAPRAARAATAPPAPEPAAPRAPEPASPAAPEPSPDPEPADLLSPALDDAQLVQLFALEERSDLPSCLERLGDSAARYSGNDPVRSAEQLEAARRELVRGDVMAAHGLLCSAIAHDPNQPGAHQTLAELALQLGDPALAKSALERALEQSPKNPTLLALMGDALAVMGDIPGSRASWLAAAPLKGSEAERKRRLASSYRLLGDRALRSSSVAQARLYFRRALILTAGGYAPSLGLSQALTGLGHTRAALAWAERAARAFPKDSRLQVIYGDALYDAGQVEAARASWQAALDVQPKHRGAARRLSRSRP